MRDQANESCLHFSTWFLCNVCNSWPSRESHIVIQILIDVIITGRILDTQYNTISKGIGGGGGWVLFEDIDHVLGSHVCHFNSILLFSSGCNVRGYSNTWFFFSPSSRVSSHIVDHPPPPPPHTHTPTFVQNHTVRTHWIFCLNIKNDEGTKWIWCCIAGRVRSMDNDPSVWVFFTL